MNPNSILVPMPGCRPNISYLNARIDLVHITFEMSFFHFMITEIVFSVGITLSLTLPNRIFI